MIRGWNNENCVIFLRKEDFSGRSPHQNGGAEASGKCCKQALKKAICEQVFTRSICTRACWKCQVLSISIQQAVFQTILIMHHTYARMTCCSEEHQPKYHKTLLKLDTNYPHRQTSGICANNGGLLLEKVLKRRVSIVDLKKDMESPEEKRGSR